MRILKYPVPLALLPTTIDIPQGSVIRHVAMQGETPCIWAEVDEEQQTTERTFRFYGTGHHVEPGWQWVGTVQQPPFVWHIFEKVP